MLFDQLFSISHQRVEFRAIDRLDQSFTGRKVPVKRADTYACPTGDVLKCDRAVPFRELLACDLHKSLPIPGGIRAQCWGI